MGAISAAPPQFPSLGEMILCNLFCVQAKLAHIGSLEIPYLNLKSSAMLLLRKSACTLERIFACANLSFLKCRALRVFQRIFACANCVHSPVHFSVYSPVQTAYTRLYIAAYIRLYKLRTCACPCRQFMYPCTILLSTALSYLLRTCLPSRAY